MACACEQPWRGQLAAGRRIRIRCNAAAACMQPVWPDRLDLQSLTDILTSTSTHLDVRLECMHINAVARCSVKKAVQRSCQWALHDV